MSESTPPPAESSPLNVLGFTATQEALYRLVLRNSGGSVAALAALAGLPVDALREQVGRLAGAGLLEVRDDVVVARPPQEALARLVSEESRRMRSRTEQLEAVRGLLPSLSADHLASRTPRGEAVTIEVLEGGDIAALVRSLSVASSGDLLFLRPDPWNTAPVHDIEDWVIDQLRSGRRSRAIYSSQVFVAAPEMLARRAEAGEEVRILPRVPTRLAVLGSSAALIAETFDTADDRRLVLRHHSMVVALTLMFDCLWEKALPAPVLEDARTDQPDVRRLLLTQLAGGAKDEQIARSTGLSVRTMRRRVAELLDDLGAESRFQAGAEAVRRGWL